MADCRWSLGLNGSSGGIEELRDSESSLWAFLRLERFFLSSLSISSLKALYCLLVLEDELVESESVDWLESGDGWTGVFFRGDEFSRLVVLSSSVIGVKANV